MAAGIDEASMWKQGVTKLRNVARSVEAAALSLTKQDEKVLACYPSLDSQGWSFVHKLAGKILDRTGGAVFSGPFAEMRLVPNSFLASRPIWVVGCYEQELDEAFCDLITNPPTSIVDIGSAHGYYMVGLATQISDIPIIGFEQVQESHWEQAQALAKLNGVSDRIVQKGFCDSAALRSVLTDGGAVLCDCEGGELDILRPDECPTLETARIICEVHDFNRPEATRTLVSRFKRTHDIRLLLEKNREPSTYRILDGLTKAEKCIAVKESKHIVRGLTSARFLWMVPK